MVFDLTGRIGTAKAQHHLVATPDTCFWGYIDRDVPAVLEVDPGDVIEIEAVTHHAGDAPDLLMDDGIRAIWSGIPEARRGPGVHVMTGPIAVRGARPGRHPDGAHPRHVAAVAVRQQLCGQLGLAVRRVRQGDGSPSTD